MMSYPVIRDILASFSPSSEFLALSHGDGRIKVWNTVKGHLQTEFADFSSASENSIIPLKSKMGHLALDYKSMKWVQLESKKKTKSIQSFLVLGTGSGDVLALEVSTGQLRWRICDCHPGGVSAISVSRHRSSLYTAGVDGMVCEIDCLLGSVVRRFRSSTKGISSLSVSADGSMLATAAGQLKVSVRCMIFSEDGNFVLSSGAGEKHIAIWKIDGGKKKSASCVLSMEHPAIFVDCRCSITEGSKVQVLYVLALSEKGICSLWHGSIEELQNAKPTKITLSVESSQSKTMKNQMIFATKFESIIRPGCALVHVARGSLVKPRFEKLSVEYGVDTSLGVSLDGVLLPVGQNYVSKQSKEANDAVTTLDRANAEEAIFPVPKLHAHEKKRKHGMTSPDVDFAKQRVGLVKSKSKTSSARTEVSVQNIDVDETICIEDRLREAGLLDFDVKPEKNTSNGLNDATMNDSLNFTVGVNLPKRKIRSQISSMSSVDASKLLPLLVSSWTTRSACSRHVLPWIYYILVIHGQFITSQESLLPTLDCLEKMMKYKSTSLHPLLKLAGRLQLMIAQINKSGPNSIEKFDSNDEAEEVEEDEEEDIDEVVYGVDEVSDSDD
ncbi:hypothetical protein HPP92_021144 [Vanilla planifolia]|uniref:Small-subunit processome Utp12 domain-containing protein n=1 Tax=Vanilla planifolia TaxID=51239 RepID=A0A835UIH7_VANPL|nr:hypothetical protein HPP92_021144 [Vanilla planifolia]